MNQIENFLSSNRAIFIILTIFLLPLAFLWSLVYGVIIGIIGSTVDCYEKIRNTIRRDVMEYLKYRKWRDEKFRENYLSQIRDERERFAAEQAIEKGKKKSYHVFVSVPALVLLGIGLYPFLLVWGIATGPIRAFFECIKGWSKVWTAG